MLYITYNDGKHDEMYSVLLEKKLKVDWKTFSDIFDNSSSIVNEYDYIVMGNDIEVYDNPSDILEGIYSCLSPTGKLLLSVNNRLGIRYFCGDRDPYTGRNFDGIENYRRAYSKKEDTFNGRMYSKSEWEQMLRNAGFDTYQFYSILSDLDNPSLIFAEDYLPNEDLANRVFPTYNYPDSVFLEEEALYAGLLENGMFHI